MSIEFPDHLERLGVDLERAWRRRYASGTALRPSLRRRRHAWRLATAGAAAIAVAGGALALGGRGADPVAAALAAVGKRPADSIVHFVSERRDAAGSVTERTEIWAATDPPYARRSIVGGIEQAASGDEVEQYDPAGATVLVRTLAGGVAEGNRPPDLETRPRQLAGSLGAVRDLGEHDVAGRRVRRLEIAARNGQMCTYEVDAETNYGLRLACRDRAGATHVQTWAFLPRTPETDRLLSVTAQHPSARVDRGPMATCPPERRHTASQPPCYVVAPGG